MAISTLTSANYALLLQQSIIGKSGQSSGERTDFSVKIEVDSVEATPSQPQTIDDVKHEFYSYLDSLAISPGLSGTSIRVNITEAAFEKMLADPEYKQKMKDLCARDLCDPAWTKMAGMGISPSACVVTIDADCKEEYLATSYNSPSARGKADGDGFWSRRTKNNEAARKAQEKRNAEKREMLEFLQELAAERKRFAKTNISATFTALGAASAYGSPLTGSNWSADAGIGIAGLL